MARTTDEIVERLGRHSKMVVAEDYEIVRQHREFREATLRDGEESGGGSLTQDWVGLRLSHRGRPGRASTSDLTEEGLARLVEEAFELASHSDGDPYFRFPLWKDLEDQSAKPTEFHYASVHGPEFSEGILTECYRVGSVETSIVRKHESRSRRHIAPQHRAQIEWIPHGDPASRYQAVRARQSPVDGLVDMASYLLLQSQWAAQAKRETSRRRSSLVLSPSVVLSLLDPLSGWFAADRVKQGDSPLAVEQEGPLFSPVISLMDVGDYPDALHSGPFDLEGVPRGETSLVERGYPRQFLYDSYTATQENRRSTGNLWRGSDEVWPTIQPSTLVTVPLQSTPGELLTEMGEGIWVHRLRDLQWDQRRFEAELLGWRVQGGKPVEPIRGIRWSGDLMDLLRRAVSVGRDLQLGEQCAAPSIYFEKVPLQ